MGQHFKQLTPHFAICTNTVRLASLQNLWEKTKRNEKQEHINLKLSMLSEVADWTVKLINLYCSNLHPVIFATFCRLIICIILSFHYPITCTLHVSVTLKARLEFWLCPS